MSYLDDTGYIFGKGREDEFTCDITFFWYKDGEFKPVYHKKGRLEGDETEEDMEEEFIEVDIFDDDLAAVLPLRNMLRRYINRKLTDISCEVILCNSLLSRDDELSIAGDLGHRIAPGILVDLHCDLGHLLRHVSIDLLS